MGDCLVGLMDVIDGGRLGVMSDGLQQARSRALGIQDSFLFLSSERGRDG